MQKMLLTLKVSEFIIQNALFTLLSFFFYFAVESQDSKDGLSVSAGEERKPPHMPEETGKSKVASWLTSQSSTSANQSVKVEGGIKTEKKVNVVFLSACFLFYFFP